MKTKEEEALNVAINARRAKSQEEGFKEGYKEGYEDGLEEGSRQYTLGFHDAKEVYMLTIGKK